VRLYVDEDIASTHLMTSLANAGHEVTAPLRGEADDRCWRYAQEQASAVLTMNAVDLVALAEATSPHHGLLLVHRVNDPTRDMTAAAVVLAIGRVVELYPRGIEGQILPLNQFRW